MTCMRSTILLTFLFDEGLERRVVFASRRQRETLDPPNEREWRLLTAPVPPCVLHVAHPGSLGVKRRAIKLNRSSNYRHT